MLTMKRWFKIIIYPLGQSIRSLTKFYWCGYRSCCVLLIAMALLCSVSSLWAYSNNDDFWHELQINLQLPEETKFNPIVQTQVNWFINHQTYLYNTAQHSAPYLYYIYQQVKQRQLPTVLVLLPFIESAYNPCVSSEVGAAGLWQLMPNTGVGFGLKQDWWYDGRRDLIASTDAALDYLTYLNNFFSGNWLLAIAAYNAGEGTVETAIQKNEQIGKPTDFWSLDLPEETELYIPRLLALAEVIATPNKYPLNLPALKAQPYFAEVDVGTPIDFSRAAQLADMSTNELYQLNSGYRRGTTDPNGPFHLLLPVEKVALFENNFAKLPTDQRVQWEKYQVQPSDTLASIASRYHTQVTALKELNQLKLNVLQPGQILQVPQMASNFMDIPRDCSEKNIPLAVKPIIYKVQKNDSLWSIAHHFNVTIEQLKSWNSVSANHELKPNSSLTIWLSQSPTPSNQTAQGNKNLSPKLLALPSYTPLKTSTEQEPFIVTGKPPRGKIYRLTYTVHENETLSQIANYFEVKESDIIKWNQLNNNTVYSGQLLTILSASPPS